MLFVRILFVGLVVSVLGNACFFNPQVNPGLTDSDPTSGSTAASITVTAGSTTTASLTTPTTIDGETTASPTTTTTTTTTQGDTSTTTTTTTTDTTATTRPSCHDTENQPINSPCSDSSGCGCDTNKCFLVPALGGFCSECLGDDNCSPGGCSVPNPIAGVGAYCNTGGPGDGCMSDAVCVDDANGICGTVLEVPGIITVATCGQCKVNADCSDVATPNCTPTYDVPNFTGKLDCVADGSVPNNQGCSLEDDGGNPAGNNACISGFCGVASIMGLLKVGVCGECNADSDCAPGDTCTDPSVDLDMGTLIGSVCI